MVSLSTVNIVVGTDYHGRVTTQSIVEVLGRGSQMMYDYIAKTSKGRYTVDNRMYQLSVMIHQSSLAEVHYVS